MPVITLYSTNSIVRATYVNSSFPNDSFEPSTSVLTFGVNGTVVLRSFLLFDIGQIPNGAIINSAKLQLNIHSSSGETRNFEIKALASSLPAKGSVTWNSQPQTIGVSATGAFDPNSTANLEMKNVVQQWVNADFANFGFVIKNQSEANNSGIYHFYSDQYANDALRPKLVIDYTLPSERKDAYFVSGYQSNASATEFTLSPPVGYQANDIMLIAVRAGSTANPITVTAGWTMLYDKVVGSYRYALAYKKIVGAEPNVRFYAGGDYVGWYGTVSMYRNAKGVSAPEPTQYTGAQNKYAPQDTQFNNVSGTMVVMNLLSSGASISTMPKGFITRAHNTYADSTQHLIDKYVHKSYIEKGDDCATWYTGSYPGVSMSVALLPIVNEPPTPPTNVRVDKTSYETGDNISVSFGTSTDPDGSVSGYVIGQYYPELGSWSTFPKFTGTPPATIVCGSMVDTNASKVRVASVDDKGLMSPYVESATFTVKQKPGQIVAPVRVTSASFYSGNRAGVVRFANGWLGSVVRDVSGLELSVVLSKDNGKTWDWSGDISASVTKGFAIEASGNMLYVLFARTANTLGLHALDVTTLSNVNLPENYTTLTGVTLADIHSMDLVYDAQRRKLLLVTSAKVSSHPSSFNLVRHDANLTATGTIRDTAFVKQIGTNNNTSWHQTYPSIDVDSQGTEFIAFTRQDGSNFLVNLLRRLPNSDFVQRFSNGTGTSFPTSVVRVSPNDVVNVSYVGIANGSPNRAAFTRSTNGGDNFTTTVDLGIATDSYISVDPNNAVHVLIENNNTIFHTHSSDGFITFPAAKAITNSGKNAVSFKDKSFKTKFTVPPSMFRYTKPGTTDTEIRYFGSIDVGKPPVVTLTSPADNLELIEGMNYTFTGTASSEVNGAVIVVNAIFGSGDIPIGTFISDGVTPYNFSKTFQYRNKQIFDGNTLVSPILAEDRVHYAKVQAYDSTNRLPSLVDQRAYTVKYNMPPVISGTNQDLGAFMQIPSVNYSATDPEANTFTFTEYLNGKQIRSFAGVAGQQYTVEISYDAWIRLDLDVQHQIKIVATDSAGISSERIYTFTRTETHIEFMLEYGNPDIKADFTLDGMPLRVLVTLERYLPEGSSIESVKVCNNYLDDVPTWEDCTGAVKGNRGYLFTNKNKTAPEWAINLWVTIDKGTAKERVLVNGYGGAFD
ncbi:DNRLRE domain-containing protein [Brevibacillus sp. HB2.2]|uniref:DNRLRE domain-containing protein n=1 Tax=Brevibacillus sp. HB2.2 TaxID=2738846 RepID=UPI00156B89E8|nr:DNRLRE domain-containing protein [Brevibacillus sp. HB2.2]NRS47280.1 DNRLRE domain-containing protein [Brevibacillus sp. HB2.2]